MSAASMHAPAPRTHIPACMHAPMRHVPCCNLVAPVPQPSCHGICHNSDASLAVHHTPYETTCNQMPRTIPLHAVDLLLSPLASSLTVRGASVQAQPLPSHLRKKNERWHAPQCRSPNSVHTTLSLRACLLCAHSYSVSCCHHPLRSLSSPTPTPILPVLSTST